MKQYHIGLDASINAKYAILPGDPARVEKIASYLENPVYVATKREYKSFIGELAGQNVLVMSTGMGGPSTAIALEELKLIGIENVLRIGTSGGMALNVEPGDIVIAQAAIRMEGTSREYLPIEFPAVANFDFTKSLQEAAEINNFSYHVGVVHCKDSFYGQHDPQRMPISYDLLNKWSAWLKGNCLASEMESSALFAVSQVIGLRAACVLNVIWNQERSAAGYEDKEHPDMDNAIRTAIKAIEIDMQRFN